MQIEIICTGDEVLTGKIVNTNFSYMAQKLEDVGLAVRWGTTVGDDRETLLAAFLHAGERADAVIVNGGLGPTVDDLSQEIAAQAAGVELVLNEEWLATMEAFFRRRSRVMSPNNRKQAMLPATAEILDNPIGTACGFALDIGKARFFFTPGVPRELRRMLEEQIIPRLLARSGAQTAIRLKRFHSYGLGEIACRPAARRGRGAGAGRQRQARLPRALPADRDQADRARRRRRRHRAQARRRSYAEVRKRLGNFIIAEDDDTLEGVVLKRLAERERLAGDRRDLHRRPDRRAHRAAAGRRERVPPRHRRARPGANSAAALGLAAAPARDHAARAPRRWRRRPAAADRREPCARRADRSRRRPRPDRFRRHDLHRRSPPRARRESRRSRILGGREWVRLGAVELGLDCLRRYLYGLPVTERIDFERT